MIIVKSKTNGVNVYVFNIQEDLTQIYPTFFNQILTFNVDFDQKSTHKSHVQQNTLEFLPEIRRVVIVKSVITDSTIELFLVILSFFLRTQIIHPVMTRMFFV